MLLKLGSGLKIAFSPVFPWESCNADLLKIHSARAFHPGHVTTRLCADLLDCDLGARVCRSLLDVGCGSGILALAASRLGVPFVVGLDIDPQAVRNSLENARRNSLYLNSYWLVGTAAAVKRRFDCITANLPYHVICAVLEDLSRLLNPGGRLILSGFHDIHWAPLDGELQTLGLSVEKLLSGDLSFYGVPPSGSFTWMAVLLNKPQAESPEAMEGK